MKLNTVYEIFSMNDLENALRDTEDRNEAIKLFNEGHNVIEHHIQQFQITTHTQKTVTYSELWQH